MRACITRYQAIYGLRAADGDGDGDGGDDDEEDDAGDDKRMMTMIVRMMMPMLRLMEMLFVEDAFFSNCNQADAGSQSIQLLTTLKLKLQCFKDLLFSLNLNSQA